MKSKVIAVVGPTASGKTKLAIDIAKERAQRLIQIMLLHNTLIERK